MSGAADVQIAESAGRAMSLSQGATCSVCVTKGCVYLACVEALPEGVRSSHSGMQQVGPCPSDQCVPVNMRLLAVLCNSSDPLLEVSSDGLDGFRTFRLDADASPGKRWSEVEVSRAIRSPLDAVWLSTLC